MPDFLRFQPPVYRNLGSSKIIGIPTRYPLDSTERTYYSLWHHISAYCILGPGFHFGRQYWMPSIATMGFDGQMFKYGMYAVQHSSTFLMTRYRLSHGMPLNPPESCSKWHYCFYPSTSYGTCRCRIGSKQWSCPPSPSAFLSFL